MMKDGRAVASSEDIVQDTSLLEAVAAAKGATIGGSAPVVGEAEAVTEDASLVGAVADAVMDVAQAEKQAKE